MRFTRRRVTAMITACAAAAALSVVLSGCNGGEAMTGNGEEFERARETNAEFKAAVSELQAQILEGPWSVGQYGDGPDECEGGYAFRMTRSTPDGFLLDEEPSAAADRLGGWLSDHGWTDLQLKTYADGIANVVIRARDKQAQVERLDIDINPGDTSTFITVRADSACQDGDPNELMADLYPGWPTETVEHEPLPTSESPGAKPVFGFTEEGVPRTE